LGRNKGGGRLKHSCLVGGNSDPLSGLSTEYEDNVRHTQSAISSVSEQFLHEKFSL